MQAKSRSLSTCVPLAVVLAALPVMAQMAELPTTQPAVAPTTEPAATQPSVATTQPTTQPVVVAPRPYDPNAKVTFNFKNTQVDSVLDYLSESLGFIVIKDGRIDGRITMASRQEVSATDAVELLNTVLKPLNYTAIQTGRVLRIVARDKAKKANIPVRFGADPTQIKASDELITQVIPIGQVDAVKLRNDLQALFSADADVTSNAGSNTLVITDSSSNIRRIVEIIAAMDRQTATTNDIKVFQLQYASATNAAKLINDLFKQDQTTQAGQQGGRGFFGFPGFNRGGQQPGAAGTSTQSDGSSGARSAGKVVASSDDRTNTLVVTGPTAVLQVIDGVVKQLDANPSELSTVFVYRLKNGQAGHLQDVLNSLFGTSSTSTGTNRTTSSSSSTRTPFGSSSFGSSSSSRSSGMLSSSSQNRSGTSNTSFTYGASGAIAQLSANSRSAISDLAGQVFVVADSDTNSLIVTTSPKFVDRVKMILADLDRAIPQVLIKVLLAEVTHSNGSDIGVQAQFLNQRIDAASGTANGNQQKIATAFGAPTTGLNVNVVEGNFQATLAALATEGKVDVLSRPYILASDNQLASILVGQEVPFITDSRTTDTGQTINTIQYQDVGIILNVTPHINPDGKVIMDVAPEISAMLTDQSVKISDTVSAPVFSKRSAQSRVAIDNGQTIVIGGMMEDKKNTTITKVPLLGDIPYLGNLFKRTEDTKSKTELLIFLTPHVAMESPTLKGMSQNEVDGVKIVPNAVAPGTFDDHMKGMQRGATTVPSEPLHAPVQPHN